MTNPGNATTEASLIAIVEDDEDLRMALAAMLADEGFATELFASADSLLAKATLDEIACIISDLQMSGINGLALAREVMRRHAVPIILITAFPAQGLDEQAAAAGVACVLRKPFDPRVLIERLRMLLGCPG